MNKQSKITKYVFIIGAVFIFCIFAYMSYRSPLAGDDWGYYVLGQNKSVLGNALAFYQTWSGRFFSEIWDFAMTKYKILWNLANPLVFVIIYLCIYFVGNARKHTITSVLLIISMMLSVFFQIRTQTYTWITGGIYSVSLCLSLLYFLLIDFIINKKAPLKIKNFLVVISNIVVCIICLMVENIAATLLVGILILIIYEYKTNNKNNIKYLLINLLVGIIFFCVMRLSPGSTFRFSRDHAEWSSLSIFEKIAKGYPYFIYYGFIKNSYIISLFSLMLIMLIWLRKEKKRKLFGIISTLIMCAGIAIVFSENIINTINFFNNQNSIFSMIFWPIYIVDSFIIISIFLPPSYEKDKCIFYLCFGGMSAAVMVMSPINGARTYIYLVYYLILVCIIVLNHLHLEDNKIINIVLVMFFAFIICQKTFYFYNLYRNISIAQNERIEVIRYYQEHPEDEDVWIKRFPENSLHSIDIEEGDNYHFEVFKEYFNLPQNANNIVFYFDK